MQEIKDDYKPCTFSRIYDLVEKIKNRTNHLFNCDQNGFESLHELAVRRMQDAGVGRWDVSSHPP